MYTKPPELSLHFNHFFKLVFLLDLMAFSVIKTQSRTQKIAFEKNLFVYTQKQHQIRKSINHSEKLVDIVNVLLMLFE